MSVLFALVCLAFTALTPQAVTQRAVAEPADVAHAPPLVAPGVASPAARVQIQNARRSKLARRPAVGAPASGASLEARRARAQAVFASQAALQSAGAERSAGRENAGSVNAGQGHFTDAELGETTPPRNVIVILLDDVGIDRLASYEALGSEPAPTPFLDVVAEQSMVFDRAYAQPVCSPSRAGALTGLRPPRTGVGTVFLWENTESDPFNLSLRGLDTLPKRVQATHTHVPVAIGKWHLNNLLYEPNPFAHPIDFGFSEFRGSMTSVLLSESYYEYPYTVATRAGAHTAIETTYATTKQIDDALDVIDRLGNKPFVMWFALHAPHTPWEAPPAELLSGALGDLSTDNKLYQATLEAADTELLRFFESLRPAILSRSVVIIVGDNGTPAASFENPQSLPFNGFKGSVGERGIHVPMFTWAADAEPGRTEALAHTDDLFATTLDLIGGDASAGLDSVSFAPVIFGGTGARTHVYAARHRPNGAGPYNKDVSAVIGDKWKLQREDDAYRLFLLSNPPNNQLWRQQPFSPNEQAQFDELKALMLEIEG
ncbi:MAG: hypothetical protein DHS20C15_05630 [Planctomycetota bacterium]|nr:MAG: hypothetical protein DHS20C15_05630 [Planctomycetota bacterium]